MALRLASLAQGARLVGRAKAASESTHADESSGRKTKGEGRENVRFELPQSHL